MTAAASTEPASQGLRPEIMLAWQRATAAGLDPGVAVRESPLVEFEPGGYLGRAAGPVLDKLAEDLAGTRFSILLADRTSTIIERRFGRTGLDKALDRVFAVPGSQYVEECSGTNSLATAFEMRRPIAVTGDEHFLDALKTFCCYGAPIFHPGTRRLEGILDISGPVDDATPLLGPFVMRAVREVEQRLVEGAGVAQQRLLAAFQHQTRRRSHPVLVLSDDLVLSNAAAADLLETIDHASLRDLGAEVLGCHTIERHMTLASGRLMLVHASTVPDTPSGMLFELLPAEECERHERRPCNGSRPRSPRQRDQEQAPSTSRVVLVVGEPGSGRTKAGQALAGPDAVVADAVDANADDGWLLVITDALSKTRPVLIDNIHALAPRVAAVLTPFIRRAVARVVLTSSPQSELELEQSALAAEALERRELRPVRHYRQDFSALATSMLRELVPRSDVWISASALDLLANQPWPGNLWELRAVLEHALRGRSQGVITIADLPAGVPRTSTRRLTVMEVAERDAILRALREEGGNRVAAATRLGIGRTTLYDRLRRYKITN